MIQDLPNADQCENYVWQKFDVMHQRTAAGVAAAAQKKIANLEIMGNANKRPTKAETMDYQHQQLVVNHHGQQGAGHPFHYDGYVFHQSSSSGGGGKGTQQQHYGLRQEDLVQHQLKPQQQEQKYYKKSSLHQIMNTPDELGSQQSQQRQTNWNISTHDNYV